MFFQELRLALRSLFKRPAYVSTAALVLAVGVGATTSMLSITDSVLWAAIPYDAADRLVSIVDTNPEQYVEEMPLSYPSYEEVAASAPSLEAIGVVHAPVTLTWSAADEPRRLTVSMVSPSLFATTGAKPVIGRLFRADEDAVPGGHPVAVLSQALWQEQFSGAEDVLGRTLVLNGHAFTVVGVLPAFYPDFPDPAQKTDLWLPVKMASIARGADIFSNRRGRMFRVLGRLRPGADPEQLQSELDLISDRLAVEVPETQGGWSMTSEPLRELFLGDYRTPTLALLAGAALLLATGCANLGNLVLLRVNEQRREWSIRRALGGSNATIGRQLVTETLLLTLLGGLPGILLATWLTRALARLAPISLPGFVDLEIDLTIYFAALAAVIVAGVGLAATAFACVRHCDARAALASCGKQASANPRAGRLMAGLMVAEIATAVILVVSAGLVVQGTTELAGIELGFEADDLLTMQLQIPEDEYSVAELVSLGNNIRSEIEAIGGVLRADIWSPHVPSEAVWYTKVFAESQPDVREDEVPVIRIHSVSPGSVSGLGLALVEGRDLTSDDLTAGRRVALVSATYARDTWPDGDPINQRVRRWNHEEWSTVVGIVGDAPLSGRSQAQTDSYRDVYFALGQDVQRDWVLLVRTEGDAGAMLSPVRSTLRRIAPSLPLYDIELMANRTAREQRVPRFTALLGSLFAVVSALLAAVGLYAVVSYSVACQRSGIGLRMALGAPRRTVQREVLKRGLRLSLLGAGIGSVVSLASTNLLSSQLYGVSPTDARTFLGAVALIVVVALLACLLPARRATRIDPMIAMRS